jgi:hypothetical protein
LFPFPGIVIGGTDLNGTGVNDSIASAFMGDVTTGSGNQEGYVHVYFGHSQASSAW